MRILPDRLDIISDDELLELANREGIDVSAIIDATDESAGAEETEEGLPPLWSEDFR
jgi:post-segregation antitoxin (ccd killing protein)